MLLGSKPVSPVAVAAVVWLTIGAGAPASAQTMSARPGSDPILASTPPRARPVRVRPLRKLGLTLKEAMVRAVAQNPELGIARVDVEVAEASIGKAEGEFEPYAFLGATYQKNRNPSFNIAFLGGQTFNGLPAGLTVDPSNQFSWNGGVRMKTPLGTSFEVRYDLNRRRTVNDFVLDPAYTPSFTAQVTQPILKGFGWALNRSFVTIAILGHEASRASFQDAALTVGLSVENAYWGYAASIENLKVAEQSLVTARQLLNNVRERRAAGTVADIEVFSAEAGVASREENRISVRNSMLNAQDQLLRLILPAKAMDAWDVRVIPLDAPRIDAGEVIDVPQAIEAAFEHRPDLRALALQIQSASEQVDKAIDDQLPTVNLTGSWTQLGLGDTHNNSQKALYGRRFYDFTLGATVEVPLFTVGARAARREAEAQRRRARKQRDALEQSIVLDLRTAARDITSGRERVRAARWSRQLAEKQLKAEQDRLDRGLATSFDVLQKQDDLTQAQTVEIVARIDYMRAKARYARAQGTLLERYDIDVR